MDAKISSPYKQRLCQRNPEQEISDLKQKLVEMSMLCLQLQEKFEMMENKWKVSEMNSSLIEDMHNSCDFAALKEKMKELVAMNVNWQKYGARQEKIISEQGEKIAQLERELAASGRGQLPESQQIEFDQLLLAKKHECSTLEDEKERAEDENRHLQQRLDLVEKSLDDYKERCGLLQTQLEMYLEDFKTERSDRERAQSKIIELETLLEAEKLRNQGAHPVQATSQYNPYESFDQPSSYAMPLRGRGIYQTDGGSKDDFTILPTVVETKKTFDGHIGQPKNPVVPAAGVYQADGFDETDNFRINLTECSPNGYFSLGDVLSCPNCRKTFKREHHLDLLEHMEECD